MTKPDSLPKFWIIFLLGFIFSLFALALLHSSIDAGHKSPSSSSFGGSSKGKGSSNKSGSSSKKSGGGGYKGIPYATPPDLGKGTTIPRSSNPISDPIDLGKGEPTIDPDTRFLWGTTLDPLFPGSQVPGTPGLTPGAVPPPGLENTSYMTTDPGVIEATLGKSYDVMYSTTFCGVGGCGTFFHGVNIPSGNIGLGKIGGPINYVSDQFLVEIEPETRLVTAGDSTTYTVTVTSQTNRSGQDFRGNVELTENLTDKSREISTIFELDTVYVEPGNPGVTLLTVSTTLNTTPRGFPFSVFGTSGNNTSTDNATLEVTDSLSLTEPDLKISSIQFYTDNTYFFTTSSFEPGEEMFVKVTIINRGVPIPSENAFENEFYLNPENRPADNCSNNPPATETITLSGLSSEPFEWFMNTTAPEEIGGATAYAFTDSSCVIDEGLYENNNITSTTYNVGSGSGSGATKPAWLQTTEGDVGTRGKTEMSQTPPDDKDLSEFILAAKNIVNGDGKWELNNYTKPLVPAGSVYEYFASRFKSKAQKSVNGCNISGTLSGYYYCSAEDINDNEGLIIGDDFAKPSNVGAVIFVDGNITFEESYAIDDNSTIVFLASENITIKREVEEVHGTLIAGGQFADCPRNDSGCDEADQLEIFGCVYASTLDLPRAFEDEEDNEENPSLIIHFEPKYLTQITELLGIAPISWQEVAP